MRESYFDAMGDSLKYASDSMFPEHLRQISCESNLGLYEHVFGGRRPDSIPEIQRENILLVYRSWMRSQMFRNKDIPWTGRLAGLSGPGRFESVLNDDDKARIKDLFNEKCFCEGGYKLEKRRRNVRRRFSELLHPFNFLSKKEDWYTIRVVWHRGSPDMKPDLFFITEGSDTLVAEAVAKIARNIKFDEEKTREDCLMHYLDIHLDLGDGEMKVKP